jgi:hypothetical protein
MRTTVDIGDDLMQTLKERARERNQTLTSCVNEVLRKGLSPDAVETTFTQKTYRLGSRPGINFHKALDLAAEMDTDYTIRKLEIDK